jgi:hypothetical protein
MLQRKKLSTTIGAGNYAYLHGMVKAGRAESVGAAVDKAAYFRGLTSKAAAEETDLENALAAASQEMDFDRP